MKSLEGKVAIVTGASRGIGLAIAKRLSRDGAAVVLNYARNTEAAERAKSEIEREGGSASLVRGDLSEPNNIRLLFDWAADRFGRLDVLVNNAGIAENRGLLEIDAAFFDRLFAVNVRATLLGIGEAARRMGAGGRIVNLSSVAARGGHAGGSVYSATKAAVEAITRVAAMELGPRGITVNAVAPGATETDMLRGLFKKREQERQKMIDATPLQRIGQPEDIADVVAFLASDDARWITGQVVTASGGR